MCRGKEDSSGTRINTRRTEAGKCLKRRSEDTWIGGHIPENGAKFLYIKIKSTNIGKVRTKYFKIDDIAKLYYDGSQIPLYCEKYFACETVRGAWPGYGEIYPNITTEGWLWFEVPENINLDETILNINGLIWKLG